MSGHESIHDKPTFEDVYRDNSRYVYNLARRLAPSAGEADDVFQEVFLRVHRFLGQYRGDGIRAWLRRITVNVFYARSRKQQKEIPQEDEFFERGSLLEDPLQKLESDQLGSHLLLALEKLSPEIRMVIVLRSIEDLSYQEIAEQLEIPIGTVRSRIARGRVHLIRLLDGGSHGL